MTELSHSQLEYRNIPQTFMVEVSQSEGQKLKQALDSDSLQQLQKLQQEGASFDILFDDGTTPLHTAASNCRTTTFEYMLLHMYNTHSVVNLFKFKNSSLLSQQLSDLLIQVGDNRAVLGTALKMVALNFDQEKLQAACRHIIKTNFSAQHQHQIQQNQPFFQDLRLKQIIELQQFWQEEIYSTIQLISQLQYQAHLALVKSEVVLTLVKMLKQISRDQIFQSQPFITPIVVAISLQADNIELLKEVVNLRFWPNYRSESCQNLLHLAIKYQADNFVTLIIEKFSFLVNSKDNQGQTPLFYAVNYRQTQNLKAILDAGADINVYDQFGKPPVFYAIQRKNALACDLLVKNNANVALTNEMRLTLFGFRFFSNLVVCTPVYKQSVKSSNETEGSEVAILLVTSTDQLTLGYFSMVGGLTLTLGLKMINWVRDKAYQTQGVMKSFYGNANNMVQTLQYFSDKSMLTAGYSAVMNPAKKQTPAAPVKESVERKTTFYEYKSELSKANSSL